MAAEAKKFNVTPAPSGSGTTGEGHFAQLTEAYAWLTESTKHHRECGLYFGKKCREIQQEFSSQGARAGGPTFISVLRGLGIPKSTAHYWILRYEVSVGVRPPQPRRPRRSQQSRNGTRSPRSTLDEVLNDDFLNTLMGGTGESVFAQFCLFLPLDSLAVAYRHAARIFHPDVGGSEDAMQRLNELWGRVRAAKRADQNTRDI